MSGIHQGQPILTSGSPLDKARAVMILVHGRGADAGGMLELARNFAFDSLAFLAPQASGYTWYPHSFMFPMEKNEPHLSSALAFVGEQVSRVRDAGLPDEAIFLLGFSQGACLTLEFAARNVRRYGGAIGLSGGLIGARVDRDRYVGNFADMPVFLGCSDVDSHIPVERVHETAEVFEAMGANVTKRIYPGMAHTVNRDEVAFIRDLLESALGSKAARTPQPPL